MEVIRRISREQDGDDFLSMFLLLLPLVENNNGNDDESTTSPTTATPTNTERTTPMVIEDLKPLSSLCVNRRGAISLSKTIYPGRISPPAFGGRSLASPTKARKSSIYPSSVD